MRATRHAFIVFERPYNGLQKDKFYLFFCGALQNAVIARHWDWRRREFTHVNNGAWMSKITQRVPHNAMVFLMSCRKSSWPATTLFFDCKCHSVREFWFVFFLMCIFLLFRWLGCVDWLYLSKWDLCGDYFIWLLWVILWSLRGNLCLSRLIFAMSQSVLSIALIMYSHKFNDNFNE